ncbi:MAG TPA: hypothetical protein VK808_05035, partial [Bacteroidia bacterium]|nr:hypothetical protein [Bacteroidia bacterium]
MKNKFFKYTEPIVFYSCLALNVLIVLHFDYISSMDAPAHLYYSRIINYLYSGNSLINSFFTINKTLSPNLTDHYLLALFNTVFRSTVSNKLLILIFFAGFPLCFRYIIKKYNPGGIALSSLSIPFTHCFLFYMGFYNFILSFTFILISIIYYLHHFLDTKDKYSAKEYITFMFLVLLNYFTNGISFLYLGITCGLIELYKLSISTHENGVDRKLWVRHILLLVLIWLPGLIMLYI